MEVWIVDDEKNLNQGLRMALEGEGYDVTQAFSLGELGQLLAERFPDVVLLDVRLPDGDGISALPSILRARRDDLLPAAFFFFPEYLAALQIDSAKPGSNLHCRTVLHHMA